MEINDLQERLFQKAMKHAEAWGKNPSELMAARLFASKYKISWLNYDPIWDEWHGSDGEVYTTAGILEGFGE